MHISRAKCTSREHNAPLDEHRTDPLPRPSPTRGACPRPRPPVHDSRREGADIRHSQRADEDVHREHPPGVVLMIEEPTMFFTSIDANTAHAYAELVNRQIAEKTTDEEH